MANLTMPTLNKAKAETQLAFKWGGIILAVIIVIFLGIKTVSYVMSLLLPPSPPEASFGKLPAIAFPKQEEENISYSIDTLTGYLPAFSDRAKVYKIKFDSPTLLGLNRAQEKVKEVGLTVFDRKISDDTMQWKEESGSLQRKIAMNIFSSDFILSSSYLTKDSLQAFSNANDKDNAIKEAESFLSKMSLFSEDIDKEKTKTSLLAIADNRLNETSEITNTKIIKVDFFQKNIDDLPIYYEKGTSSTIDFFVAKENDQMQVVEGKFLHKNVSQNSSTYAIKTAQNAFQDLQKGKAYIVQNPSDRTNVVIKNVFLGYYIGEAQQNFLMPIVVFEGEDDFMAYVSAVKDEWINN